VIEALLKALTAETVLHQDLVAVLERERDLLGARSLDRLLQVTQEKEAVIERIRSQAGEAKRLVKELAAAQGLKDGGMLTLSRLAGLLKEPDRTRLLRAQAEFVAVSGTALELNQVNDRLIHRSLVYVSQYHNLLQALVAGSSAYLPTGAVSERPQSGRIVTLKG
jgi:flagellar biosynthesis/type III secretory pathway chaperone